MMNIFIIMFECIYHFFKKENKDEIKIKRMSILPLYYKCLNKNKN
jgi:cbb3-type cytochrome oxidase subunit 3